MEGKIKMEYIYAALLLHKSGKEINEENLNKVISAAGLETDVSKIKSLTVSLKGVDIDKELENATLVATAPASASGSEQKTEAHKEEKHKEDHAPAAEGLSALFG